MKLGVIVNGLWNLALVIGSIVCIFKASNFADKELYAQAAYYMGIAILLSTYHIANTVTDKLDAIKQNAESKNQTPK